MPVDVLERFVTAVTHAAEGLHGLVGGVAHQSVGAVVGHRHLVGDLQVVVAVQVPGRVIDQQPHHLGFGLQLRQRPLHGLVDRQRPAEHDALTGVLGGAVDAVLCGPQAAGRLPNPVLVQESLRDLQPAVHLAEHRIGGYGHIGELDLAVVAGHVECPPVERDGETRRVGGDQERGDAPGMSGLTGGAGEDQVVGGAVHAGVPPLGAVDHPAVAVGHGAGLQPGCVRPVFRLGEPERHRAFPGDQRLRPFAALRVGAEPLDHDHLGEIADDRRLVLQVVVQSDPFGGQMFTDDGHVEVGAVPAAQRRRQPVAQPAGLVGPSAHLVEQVLPFPPWDAAALDVGAGELAPMIEVLHVLCLQRRDLGVDERVDLGEHARKVFW